MWVKTLADVKIEGLQALISDLDARKYSGKQIRNVVMKNGANLQEDAQKRMTKTVAYVKGYSKGTTRRSTTLTISDNGMKATVAPATSYFPYVEYGTRYMEAEPTLNPAFQKIKQQFYKDVMNLVKK